MTLRHKIVLVYAVIMIMLTQSAISQVNNDDYKKTIESADKYFSQGDYISAKASYQLAVRLAPEEQYPKDRLQQSLDMINIQIYQDNLYTQEIKKADSFFQQTEFALALQYYQEALSILPGNVYASEKMQEITSYYLIDEQVDSDFQRAIILADRYIDEGKLNQALTVYRYACTLKPYDTYAKEKAIETKALIAWNKGLPDEYQKPYETYPKDTIREIEALPAETLKVKDYQKVLADHEASIKLKPWEIDAQGKTGQINTIIADITAKEIAAKEIAAKEIAVKEIAAKEALDKQYQDAIDAADKTLQSKDYEKALGEYQSAMAIKPAEQYAEKQVSDQLIIKRHLVQQEYDLAIIHGDKYLASKTYDNALESYRAASRLIPDEEYPKIMANHILKLLIERSIVQINNSPVIIPNNTTHKFDFIPVPAGDRKSNYIFFRARNLSNKEYKLIVSFGEGQSKNGGVIVKVPPSDSNFEFIIRIGSQYKWFSEDNNWITCLPEGGDIEVSFMQISYSD